MEKQNKGDIVIYQSKDGLAKIDVRFEDETVWLTQAQLVELYQSGKANISEHIKHIFEEGELDEISVVRNFRTTAADGKDYNTKFYNLDMIISLGYRVKSKEFMGLTTFAGDFPTKKDIAVAKNYLTENELKILSNLVSAYFDLAEINAMEHNTMYMSDYVEQLDRILSSTGWERKIENGEMKNGK